MSRAPIYSYGPIARRHYGSISSGEGSDYDVWKKLMKEWYGFTPAEDGDWIDLAVCPCAVLTGEPHEHWTDCDWDESDYREFPGVWRHARAWHNSDGDLVITLEPYGSPLVSADKINRLETALADRGIVVVFEGRDDFPQHKTP